MIQLQLTKKLITYLGLGACSIGFPSLYAQAKNNLFSYAVSQTVNNQKTQKQSLFSVLKELNKQKGTYFFFSDSTIADKQVNAPDTKEGSIENILDQVLKNTGLKHKKISTNTFVITVEKKLALIDNVQELYNLQLQPENIVQYTTLKTSKIADKKVTGKVVNAKDGTPLEGVSVVVKGRKTGTFTNAEGGFTVSAADDAVLEFGRVGYVSTNVKVSLISANNPIQLQEAENNLTDVVVSAYSSAQKRTTYTGAASTVRNAMIEDVPRSSVQESLQGNVSGVLATNGSGQPGSAPSIRIRGIGSINASSSPLYVIDGVPVVAGDISNGFSSNTIASLNGADVQSMVVLKDASATALYGSRGANGVILITTKKGKSGKTKYNFNVQQGVNLYTIRDKDKMMTTQQTIQYLREGWANAGRDPNLYNAEIVANGIDTTVNTDWFDQILSQGNYTRAGLSASGGNSKTTFYISGSLYKQEGVQQGVDYDRVTTLLNINHKESEKFNISAGFSATYQKGNSFRGGTFFDNPIRALYRVQPWLPVYNADGSFRTDFNNGYNPVAIAETNIRQTNTYVIRGNVGATYNLKKWLSYESKVGVDFSNAFNNSFNDARYGNANVAAGGIAGNFSQNIVNWVYTNILRAKKTFGEHNVETFIGYETTKREDNSMEIQTRNIQQGLTTAANASVTVLATGDRTASSLISTFINANYDYKSKYILSGSIRSDGSSKFGSAKRYGLFWSIGGAWMISKEKFFKSDWVNELRLRASYGATGNSIGIDDFASRGLYNTNGAYNLNSGTYYNQIRNDSLTWEKNYPLNIGLDFTILRGRISGTIEYYNRKTTDLLLTVPVAATNGITGYTDNFGQMRNQGFEITISSVNMLPKKAKGFKWVTEFTFATNRNTILKLNFPFTTNSYRRQEGLDFYQWNLKSYAGVDPANGQALWHADSAKTITTNSWNTGRFNTQGSALPKFFGGIMNSITYQGFTLMFHIYYHFGNKVLDDNGDFLHSDGSGGFNATTVIPVYDFNNRWRKPGDIVDVPAPVFFGTQTGLNTFNSTRFLYDGSYVRLRDIQLSYNLKGKFISKSKLASARIYIRANNLFTWVKDKRLTYDPETPVDGTLNQRPPVFKTILAGIDINF